MTTGDSFRKVRGGERLNIPARTWNAMIDAARASAGKHTGNDDGALNGPDLTGTVWVRNDSGSSLLRFKALGIDGVVFEPDSADIDAPESRSFSNRIVLKGVTPVESDHFGKFVVLAEPIANGKIGRAWAGGVFPGRVNITTPEVTLTRADVAAGSFTLDQRPDGCAEILWREEGTGEKYAILRMGPRGPQLIAGVITAVNGSSFSATYDVTSDDGQYELLDEFPIARFFGAEADIIPAEVDDPCVLWINSAGSSSEAKLLWCPTEKADFTDCEGGGGGGGDIDGGGP